MQEIAQHEILYIRDADGDDDINTNMCALAIESHVLTLILVLQG